MKNGERRGFGYRNPREVFGLTNPPPEWYTAIANNPEEPIRVVLCSSEFYTMADGFVGHEMDKWGENSMLAAETDDTIILSAQQREQHRLRSEEAAANIKRLTGFTPEEVHAELLRLREKYIGSPNADIPTVYLNIYS